MPTQTYTPIAVITANGSSNVYTFSSIPQTYTDLVLVMSLQNGQSGGAVSVRFNSDTSSNYSRTFFYGAGTTAASGRASSVAQLDGGGTNPSGSMFQWNIFNYTNTTTFKTCLGKHIEPTRLLGALAGLWRKTPEAINAIEVTTQSALYAGQTLLLYGIKAGS
jgi:hypothetical protein